MNYQKYIKSHQWTKFRQYYFKKTLNITCLVCNDPNVDLHHWTYENLGKENLTDVFPLCTICHQKLHRFLDNNKNIKLSDHDLIFTKLFNFSKEQTKTLILRIFLGSKTYQEINLITSIKCIKCGIIIENHGYCNNCYILLNKNVKPIKYNKQQQYWIKQNKNTLKRRNKKRREAATTYANKR